MALASIGQRAAFAKLALSACAKLEKLESLAGMSAGDERSGPAVRQEESTQEYR